MPRLHLKVLNDQERHLTFVKRGVLKHKFHACSFKKRFLFSSQTKYCES